MQSTRNDTAAFVLRHVLLIPGAFALCALYAAHSGLDRALAQRLFDPIAGAFVARPWNALELFGHRFAKSAVYAVWFAVFLVALASSVPGSALQERFRGQRKTLWATVVGMGAGPCLVVWLKGLNAHHCPWDLKEFGGYADMASGWFVPSAEVGHCFPGGHSSAGFSLVAFYFAGLFLGRPSLARAGLIACLVTGGAFSLIRMAQGAHFLSHNLWAAAICWAAAALAFLPLLPRASAVVSGVAQA